MIDETKQFLTPSVEVTPGELQMLRNVQANVGYAPWRDDLAAFIERVGPQELHPFTVIVGRPDDVSDNPITDTYMDHVMATDPVHANALACAAACVQDDEVGRENDYVVIATFLGHLEGQ